MSDESHLWEHIDGLESAQQYAAFEDYRDQDPKHRTLASAARRSGLSYPTLYRWSRENYWADRVASYDRYRAEQRAQERIRQEQIADVAWAERRAELFARVDQILLKGLDTLAHDLETGRYKTKPNELARMLRDRLHYGNATNGDATDRVDNVIDLSNATPEQLAALESLRELGKAEDDESE